ncbi:MAG: flagellin [Phycisphaerales bacterium]|nr:flagellin [Phycisphaerales bacterium]
MSRINTNIPSLIARRVLNTQNDGLNTSLQRLSTGLRVNNGKDDPAGLIASETLRNEEMALQAAIGNVGRAVNVVSVAEAGLVEVNNLLTELETLIDRSANEAGISEEERNANQLQIDAILNSINRIANSTEFQGRKLLGGELGFSTSGVLASAVSGVQVYAAKISNNSYRNVVVAITASAQKARLDFTGSAVGAGSLTLEVSGSLGTDTISVASGATVSAVAYAINQISSVTGVTASSTASSLAFLSTNYGSSEFVSIRGLNRAFTVSGGDAGADRDNGRDASVTINGTTATTQGLKASIRDATLSIDIDLTSQFGNMQLTSDVETFQILDGGADFMIAPKVNLAGTENIGLNSITIGNLGSSTLGFLSSLASGQTNSLASGNYGQAQSITRAAQSQVANLRGRLGAFQKNTLETTANALRVSLENATAAESAIRDTDFAEETSKLTRQQILVQSATNVLRIANSSPQNVLALLG